MNKLSCKIYLVILSTDIPNNKKYVLSSHKTDLILPSFELNNTNSIDIESSILDFIKNILVVSPLELKPSLLSINSKAMPSDLKEDNALNILYGSVIPLNHNLHDVYWQEFDFFLPHPYSNLLFEVVHSLT